MSPAAAQSPSVDTTESPWSQWSTITPCQSDRCPSYTHTHTHMLHDITSLVNVWSNDDWSIEWVIDTWCACSYLSWCSSFLSTQSGRGSRVRPWARPSQCDCFTEKMLKVSANVLTDHPGPGGLIQGTSSTATNTYKHMLFSILYRLILIIINNWFCYLLHPIT